jgi:hypothetical protein
MRTKTAISPGNRHRTPTSRANSKFCDEGVSADLSRSLSKARLDPGSSQRIADSLRRLPIIRGVFKKAPGVDSDTDAEQLLWAN